MSFDGGIYKHRLPEAVLSVAQFREIFFTLRLISAPSRGPSGYACHIPVKVLYLVPSRLLWTSLSSENRQFLPLFPTAPSAAGLQISAGFRRYQAQCAEQALIAYHGRQGVNLGGSLVNVRPGTNVGPANAREGFDFLRRIDYWGRRIFSVHSGGSGI